jgi:hypothetical protein
MGQRGNHLSLRSSLKQFERIMPLSLILLMLFMSSFAVLWSAEFLTPGLHKHQGGDKVGQLTLSVPSAIGEGKPLPVLFVLSENGQPVIEPWQDWSNHRGVLVVGISVITSTNSIDNVYKIYQGIVQEIKKLAPIDDIMRLFLVDRRMYTHATTLALAAGQEVAGVLYERPATILLDEKMRPDLPLVIIRSSLDENNEFIVKLLDAGKMARVVSVLDLESNAAPPFPVVQRCLDYTLNLARVTHKKLSVRERANNLDDIAKQIQELPGILDDELRLRYAQYLMLVPGMEKRRSDNERLADIWLDSAVKIALAKEKEDKIEGHEWLSGITKSDPYKEASGKYKKMAYDELMRMRRDAVIKKEIAASDLYGGILAMLERDQSTAKLKIVAKELGSLMAQYPTSNAAKNAAKLLTKVKAAIP